MEHTERFRNSRLFTICERVTPKIKVGELLCALLLPIVSQRYPRKLDRNQIASKRNGHTKLYSKGCYGGLVEINLGTTAGVAPITVVRRAIATKATESLA